MPRPKTDHSKPSTFASRRAAQEAREAENPPEPRRQFSARVGDNEPQPEIRHVEA